MEKIDYRHVLVGLILAVTIKKYISLLLNFPFELLALLLCLDQLRLFLGNGRVVMQRVVDQHKAIILKGAARGEPVFEGLGVGRREDGVHGHPNNVFYHFGNDFAKDVAIYLQTWVGVGFD